MSNGIMQQVIPYTDITVSRIFISIALLVVGFAFSKYLIYILKQGIKQTKLPELTIQFIIHFLNVFFYIIIFLAFLKSLNFDVDSYIVGISAVIGLVLGLGMQDTMTNIAAGVWVVATRPIDMGETVTLNDQTGKVKSVKVMSTELLTPDNQLITIPNKLVWGSSIVNMTRMPTRRVSVDVGISYSSELKKAVKIALELMKANPLILHDPSPEVVATELGNSSINLQLRAWTKTGDFGSVKNTLTAGILQAYSNAGIEIPFPQMEVYIKTPELKDNVKQVLDPNIIEQKTEVWDNEDS
jgi:small conductance mechanosensitive channel